MNNEEQLIITGRVIDAARKIESKLIECGATGSGLREKADSLDAVLPKEVTQLIHFIGTIRNRVAHESGTMLRPDELQLFEEAALAVLDELDGLKTAPAPAPAPSPAPAARSELPPTPPPEPDDEPDSPADSVPRNAKPRAKKTGGDEPLLPPWNSPLWAALPGLHLIYAFGAGWNAFGAGQLYLLLVLAELIALTALGFAAALASLPLAAAGGTLFLVVYGCGIYLGLDNPPEQGGRAWFCLIPFANLAFFVRKIVTYIKPDRLVVSIVIFGTWLAAIQLAISKELLAAGIAALASWLCALIDALVRR